MDDVIAGKNKWMYYNTNGSPTEQYRGLRPFTEPELDDWISEMKARCNWLSEMNIPFLIAIVPDKQSVYPENLPGWANKKIGPSRLDQLLDALEEHPELDVVDLRPAVMAAKNYAEVYYRTDSHWNAHGAFAGYAAMMERIKRYFPDVKVLKKDDFEFVIKPSQGLDLAKMLNLTSLLKENDVIVTPRFPHVNVPEEFPINEVQLFRSTPLNPQKILFFRDSYLIGMLPFFKRTFEVCSLYNWGKYVGFTFKPSLVRSYEPDMVIYELVERRLISPNAPTDWDGDNFLPCLTKNDLVASYSPQIFAEGLGAIEGNDRNKFRWAFGPETKIIFNLPSEQRVLVSLRLGNSIPDQKLVISVADRHIEMPLPTKDDVEFSFVFMGKPGSNQLRMSYADWNHHKTVLAPDDDRFLSVAFKKIEIGPE
ncbi:MAG: hypothetical protein HQK56_08225 [Deltaproteobacteria bacterium]|nr:hypothetical protein [Deltaproteobacteria bacterium]